MSTSIAYFILAHSCVRQTIRLLKALYNPKDQFVLHVDKRSCPKVLDDLREATKGLENFSLISTRLCSWGGLSLVDATLDMMSLALQGKTSWSHGIILSGTHLPLWSPNKIRDWVQDGQSIMSWHQLPDGECPRWLEGLAERVEWEYVEHLGRGMVKTNAVQRPNFPYFKGSQWSILAKEHVNFVVGSAGSEIERRLRITNIPDESYFQTILLNSDYSKFCIQGNITQFKWVSGASSPSILDFDQLSEMARNRDKPFIRKIDNDLGDEKRVVDLLEMIYGHKLSLQVNCN
ncbi:MAG: beta-1,6-N-acetylglucosaminyltransferase [Azospirillaceae bacterium]|nr:beta-1,6-N-acetylglucosaminyltransferase [Azospirillaceae bacterium]